MSSVGQPGLLDLEKLAFYGYLDYSHFDYGDAVRVFKTRLFARFERRERIGNGSLLEAVARAERGLIDADLGGGLIKQRVARQGQGRSGGYRMLLAFRAEERVVFLFGFAKSDRENLDAAELAQARLVAEYWLAADAAMIETALNEGLLIEVDHDAE